MDIESGSPKDGLHPEALAWMKTIGVDYKNLSEILAAGPCPKVFVYFRRLIYHYTNIYI